MLVVQIPGDGAVDEAFTRADQHVCFGRPIGDEEIQTALEESQWDAIIFDCDVPDCDPVTTLKRLRDGSTNLPFIALSTSGDLEQAVELMRLGARDYLLKGKLDRLVPVTLREIEGTEPDRPTKDASPRDQENTVPAENSLALLNAAIEALPVGIIITDTDGRMTIANSAALGRPADPGRTISDIPPDWRHVEWQITQADGSPYHRDDRPLFRAMHQDRAVKSEMMLITRNDDEPIWVTAGAAPIRDAAGRVIGGVVVHSDINALKWAEKAMRESEARFRLLIDHAPEAIVLMDMATGRFTHVNSAAAKMFKLSAEELCRKGPLELSPTSQPDGSSSVTKAKKFIELAAKGETPLFEWTHCDANGGRIPCEIRLLQLEQDGRPIIRGSITDISERKRAQEALRHSEERLRQLVESSPFCIHEIDLDNRLKSMNDAGLNMLGLATADSILGTDYLSFVPERERPEISAKLAAARYGATVNFQLHLKSGQIFDSTTKPIRDDAGQITGLIGITQDITEREQSRQRLQLSQFMLDHITEAAFLVAEDGSLRDANPAACRMLGYSRNELLQLHVWDVNAVYAEKDWPQLRDTIDSRGTVTRESLHRRRDGTVFEVEVGSNLFVYRDQRYHVTTVRDISERKQTEIALRDSEERFRTLATNAPVGIFQTDREGRCIYVNSTWCRLAGIPPQDALGGGWMNAIHPDDQVRVSHYWSLCFDRNEACLIDYRLRHADGTVHWIAADALPLPGPDGHRGYIGTIVDISERQKAQLALETSQERYAMATRAANDGIWDFDLLTGVSWWNESYDHLWGTRPPETNDSPAWWFDHIHPNDVERVQKSFNTALHNGTDVWHCSYRYRRTNGEYAEVLDRAYITRDATGKATRILGAMADITELKHREQQLAELARRMNAIREEERKHIAREIHDQLGQIMTVLKMNLIQLEDDILTLPATETRNRLEDDIVNATTMIDSSIESVRAIALRIRPSVLDQLGLAAALQQECEHFGQRNQITCPFTAKDQLPALTDETQTGLFRLTQEFLTNVTRHAKATEVAVRLGRTDNFVRLEVQDDGVGFDQDAAHARGHLGLVGARERVENLNGILELITKPGHGTLAVVTIPVRHAILGKNEENSDSR